MLGHILLGWLCLATYFQDDNAWPHIAKMTLQKLTDFGYSPDLPPTDNHFLNILTLFLCQKKTFCSKGKVETTFKDFYESKPLEFYRTGVNNLVNWLQKSRDFQGSDADLLKHYLYSLIQDSKWIIKGNIIARPESELSYNIVAVLLINHHANETQLRFNSKLQLWDIVRFDLVSLF